MFLECSICGVSTEILKKDKKYIIQEEEFCCSPQCTHTWLLNNSARIIHRIYPQCSEYLRLCIDNTNSVLYKSEYEKAFAYFLHKIVKTKFVYEGFGFKLSNGTYTPDFWTWGNLFFETKGKIGLGFRQKLKRFRREHPRIKLLFVPWVLKDQFYKYLR